MLELFKVAAKMVLDRSEYDHDVNEVDKSGKSLAENLSGYFEKAKKVLSGVMSAIAIQKVASGIWNLAKETSAAGDRIDKMSQSLGLSRKAFQEWDYILAQNGASIDSMGMSMKTMQEAISGNSAEVAVALSKLGLSSARLQSMKPEEQFEELVKAFQKMPPSAQKSQYAMLLFGRNAQSLMPLLNSASGSVDELRNRAHELGLIMSDEDVDASVAFGDALDDLSRVWTAVKQKFGAQMLPVLTRGMVDLANSLGRITNSISKAFKSGDWSGVFDTITNEIKTLLPKFIDTVVNIGVGLFQNADKIISLGFSIVTGLISGLREHLPTLVAKLPDIFKAVVDGIKELGTAAGNGFIDLINLAFGTNIPHLEDIKWPSWSDVSTFATEAWTGIKEGLESLATTVGKWVFGERDDGSVDWPTWDDVGRAASDAWQGIKEGIASLVTSIGKFVFGERDDGSVEWPTWNDVGQAARNAIQTIVTGLSGLVNELGKFIFGERDDGSVKWPTWTEVGQAARDALKSIITGLGNILSELGKFIFGERDDSALSWPTWDEVGELAKQAWEGIKSGLENYASMIGAFIFGTRDDGSVDWPTWDDVQQKAKEAWQGIKEGLEGLTNSIGKFIFGERDDGSVKWPTWTEVGQAARDAWEGIKTGLSSLVTSIGKFVFGERDDGSIKWPTWAEVGQAARDAWKGIITGLGNLVSEIGKFIFGERDDSAATQWITWDDVKDAAEKAWNSIVAGLSGLLSMNGAFIFGTRDDGSVDWPTWDDVQQAAHDAWEGIKTGLAGFVTSIGSFIFGKRDDEAINWPTWDSIKKSAEDAWRGIKEGLANLVVTIGKFVFGEKDEDSLSWIETIRSWFSGEGIKDITIGFIDGTIGDFIGKIRDWFDNGIDLTVNFLKGKIDEWITRIWNWVNNGINVAVNFLGDLFGGNGGYSAPEGKGSYRYGGDYIPSLTMQYAKGLNYVPYDGYLASLHRGEVILNQSQGREWRQNQGGFNADQLYNTVASAVAVAVGNIQINMNGKAVANAVSGQVSRNLYQDALGRRYAAV